MDRLAQLGTLIGILFFAGLIALVYLLLSYAYDYFQRIILEP